jgi:hypothetical protein
VIRRAQRDPIGPRLVIIAEAWRFVNVQNCQFFDRKFVIIPTKKKICGAFCPIFVANADFLQAPFYTKKSWIKVFKKGLTSGGGCGIIFAQRSRTFRVLTSPPRSAPG